MTDEGLITRLGGEERKKVTDNKKTPLSIYYTRKSFCHVVWQRD